MKNFKNHKAEKYDDPVYEKMEDSIYRTKSPYNDDLIYVTSLSFEQEPECYGEEEGCPQDISQIPLEDLLDTFSVFVTDFYQELNEESETICYQEFGSSKLEDIQKLRTMIGKRIYAVPYIDEDEEYYEAVIE